MSNQNQELTSIIMQFAESGWDLIDAPANLWIEYNGDCEDTTKQLIAAIKQADNECGSCGCDMDSLYKKALDLLKAA